MAREIGDRWGEGCALNNLGNTYNSLGEYGRAIELYQQALGIFREIGDRRGEGCALNNLGERQIKLAEYDKALENL